jgi:hypothetical protein
MCKRLLCFVQDEDTCAINDWAVVCVRVERVKSYAPQIHHYVADVFTGPSSNLPKPIDLKGSRAGIVLENEKFEPCPVEVEPPSCALSLNGVLHQHWMMDDDTWRELSAR